MNKLGMNQDYHINQVEEIIETDELYTIMNKRLLFCKNIETSEELYGPADICYLVKESQNKGFLGLGAKKVSRQGCYHHIYGLDTSNIAYISAYISKYISKNVGNTSKDKDSIKIIQSIFCVFDYFLEKDLRILIKFPGGIKKVFFIDDQQAIEANTEDLRTVYLSSLMRSWNLKSTNPNCVYLEEINNIDSFNFVVEWITNFVKENPEFKYPNFKKKLQKLIESFFIYLRSSRRFNISISFFSKLTTIDLSQIKYVIKTLNYLLFYEESLKYIATYLVSNPTSSILSLEVNILCNLKKFDEALEIGKINCSLNPENCENWLSLSEVYLRKKQYENCLKALNNIYVLKEFSLTEFNKVKGNEISFKE
jgi:tetratricopeptide (TPR) repeat protein